MSNLALRLPTKRESWLYAIANLGSSITYQDFSYVLFFFFNYVIILYKKN